MYNDKMEVCPMPDPEVDIPTCTEITQEVKCMMSDALVMAYAINKHLFGKGMPENQESYETKCFRDDLCLQGKIMGKLCEELRDIMKGIGV